jgi:hypothetical protein
MKRNHKNALLPGTLNEYLNLKNTANNKTKSIKYLITLSTINNLSHNP